MPISLDCQPEMKLLCAILLLTIGLLFIPIFSVGLMPEMDLKYSLCSQIIDITSLKHVMPPPLGYIVFYSVQGLGDFTGPLSILFSRQAGLTRLVYFHLLCRNDNNRIIKYSVLRICQILSYVHYVYKLIELSNSSYCYYPYFTDDETEAQRG